MIRWLYPDKCALCGLIGRPAACAECQAEMVVAASPRSDVPPLAYRATLYRYESRAAQAVRRLKYARSTGLAEWMAAAMAPLIEELADDLVVPVPIHPRRRGERGFNQAELLCAGNHGRLVDASALRRIRATPPQASLPLALRAENLRDAFRAHPKVAGRKILLVDDVLTTGHTARACAESLVLAGASEVGVVAFAG